MNKIGAIKNPLSVIAVFAGVAEISGTSVLPFISEENQKLYIFFLISFPFTLVLLFFSTLNWNHRSLYAPSDFKSDESFLESANSSGIRRADIASMEKTIEEKVNEVLNSNGQSEEGFEKSELAKRITDSIKSSSFITVDAREFTGQSDKVFELPYVALASLTNLTDEIFYLLDGAVGSYEYGHSWVLKNVSSGKVIKNSRMITGGAKGFPVIDNRGLAEVDILPGSTIVVERPEIIVESYKYRPAA